MVMGLTCPKAGVYVGMLHPSDDDAKFGYDLDLEATPLLSLVVGLIHNSS